MHSTEWAPAPADAASANEAARVVELSEARAYYTVCSLAAGRTDAVDHPLRVGSGVLLSMPAAPREIIFNRVLGLGVAEPANEPQLDAVVARFGARRWFGVELAPIAAPPDLPQWLRARRLRRSMLAKAMLIRDAQAPVPDVGEWSRRTGLTVVGATDAADAATVAQLSCRNFRVHPAIEPVLAQGTQGGGWRRWLVRDGRQPIGAALLHVDGELAWLGWTSVNAEARGRGAHAGLVLAALADARAAGCRFVTTETATGTSQQPDHAWLNMRKAGFQEVGRRATFLYAPAMSAAGGDAAEPAVAARVEFAK